MSDLHIERLHQKEFQQAREIAKNWQLEGEQKWGLECTYTQGDEQDELVFKRSGVQGVLLINQAAFILNIKLGFLLKPYKQRIKEQIIQNLDVLLGAKN